MAIEILISSSLLANGVQVDAVNSLLKAHRIEMTADRQGSVVLSKQQGAFVSYHENLAVREEFGFAGHVIYVMTRQERISDRVELWLELEGVSLD